MYIPSCFALLLALVCLPAAQGQSANLKKIAPGVWFRTGMSNTAIIEMKDYLVVIDSGMADTARATQADCRAISDKPVKFVFITHSHFDHVDGNALWTAAGAETIAFAAVKEEMTAQKAKAEAPRRILPGEEFVLDDGTRRLEFHTYGWAHTRGDGIAWLPKEKVLATGDTVLSTNMNYFAQSDPRNWPKVIRRLERLEPRHVLPGHGDAGSGELLSGQRAYLEALAAAVEEAIRDGKKWEDLVEMKDGKPGASRIVLPAAHDRWAKDGPAGPSSGRRVRDLYQALSR